MWVVYIYVNFYRKVIRLYLIGCLVFFFKFFIEFELKIILDYFQDLDGLLWSCLLYEYLSE